MTKNTKDWVMYSSAIIMLVSGIFLSILNFFLSGYIDSSVLIYVSQALVYSGSIYGVSMYVKQSLDDYKMETTNKLADYVKKKVTGEHTK